jgi:hypothetical protein
MATRFANLKALKDYLNKIGYTDIKDKDARSIFVLTNDKRETVFNNLLNQLGGRKNASRNFGGSMGHIDVEQYRVGVKPLSAQGSKSAGVENEANLVQAINYVIQQYGTCDVMFTDGTHKFLCKEATEAKQVGADTAGRKKADLLVMSGSKQYPISLKKDNAEYWESADSFWRDNATKYLTEMVGKKKVIVQGIGGGVVKISPSIGVEATQEEATDVIFGSDILGKGCVVTRTFDGTEFRYDGKANCLTITVSSVITKLSDVPSEKKVWFLIRNDSTRKSIPTFPGTRALASYKSRINSNVLQITAGER